MRLPDFLVIGAQKSGTTSLFMMLRSHPDLCLPSHKEVQFFSSDKLYDRGLEWYSKAHFSHCPNDSRAGEVSPQYMYNTATARRIHKALPKAQIIAILREPLDRAFSQFLMSKRRGQETRSVAEAFAASETITEAEMDAPEYERYFQFSDYESVLSEYLRLYGHDQILLLFQEDLDRAPGEVLRRAVEFLGVDYVESGSVGVRAHQSGEVRFKALEWLTKTDNVLRRALRRIVPARFRPAIMFWAEIRNVKPKSKPELSPELRKKYLSFARRQAEFLAREFDVVAPWKIEGESQ